MHPTLALALHRQRQAPAPGVLGDAVDDLADKLVGVFVPALQARVPELATSFVSTAVPQVQERLTELQPQLTELAREAARQVLGDDQVQASVKEATDRATRRIGGALVFSTLTTVAAVVTMGLYLDSHRRR